MTSPPDGFKQRSAFKTIRSVSCDTSPSSPSIIKNNKNTNPHRITQLLWGALSYCPFYLILLGIPSVFSLGLWTVLFGWIGRCRRPLRVEEVKSTSLFDLWTGGEFIRTKIYGDVFRCSRTDFCYSPPVLVALLSLFCGERSFCALMWRTLSPTPPASRLAPGLTLRFASSPLFALVPVFALGTSFAFAVQCPFYLLSLL